MPALLPSVIPGARFFRHSFPNRARVIARGRMRLAWRCRGWPRSTVDTCTGMLYLCSVAVETTYTALRERLAAVLEQVVNHQEVVIVRRRGAKDVALVPADELNSLMETAHLL